jgi:VWFA-related protein
MKSRVRSTVSVLFVIGALFAAAIFGFSFQKVFRSEVSLVNVHFNALDGKGRTVGGLEKGDFEVFENGIQQDIEFFSETGKNESDILTLALLIDTSGSVKDQLRYEIDTASEFLKEILRPNKDLALIIQFDSEVSLIQDFTQNQGRLLRALNGLRAGNDTSLYDAIYLAADEKLRGEAGRKVMVVISDGEDTASLVSRREAIEAAQKSDAIIFGIGVRSENFRSNFDELRKFCEQTGGEFFSPSAKFDEIQQAFLAIRKDILGQYSLAYSPKDKRKDGSFREIEIRCKKPGVRIRARKGYYAPQRERGNEAP